MMEKHQCQERIISYEGMARFEHRCPSNGTRQENGQWWCGRHAPSIVAAKRKEREAKWDAERLRDHHLRQLQARREELRIEIVGVYLLMSPLDPKSQELLRVDRELKELKELEV